MATTNNDFMQNILNEEAWKDLSSDFEWTETLLEKYQNKVNWDEISSNSRVQWTVPMIKKFARRINWSNFSSTAEERFVTPDLIETFKDLWDWHELSNNSDVDLTYELLEKYADLWDWEKIIDAWRNKVFEGKGVQFYNKFQQYIPASKLQNSSLWREMVDEQKQNLIAEIIS